MRVLILSCNTGEGHNSCAKAIQESFRNEEIDCGIQDALTFISPGMSRFISSWHTRIYRYVPQLFRMGYRLAEHHQEMFREDSLLSRQLFARGTQRLWEFLCNGGYDIVVCTHVFASLMLTDVRRRHSDWNAWCAFVNTDYTCSPSTGDSKLDRYFTPEESLNGEFTALGIPEERLVASGIPILQAFLSKLPKTQAKAALGIPEGCPHLLIMCGSMGCGPIRKLTWRIAAAMKQEERLSVVCGTNRRLYQQLRRRYREDDRVQVLGYADNVPLLMDSADLFLTKPGGLSVTEAEAKGLPMVLINAVAGCEDYNKRYLMQKGCAVEETTVDALASRCLELLRDSAALERMSACCGTNRGAEQIVQILRKDAQEHENGRL